jgi:hypothetical protein
MEGAKYYLVKGRNWWLEREMVNQLNRTDYDKPPTLSLGYKPKGMQR